MTSETEKKSPGQFSVLLRRWRRIRGVSQLSLAYMANTSPRHISFLETGRARPGKELVMELCKVLRLSLRDVNALMYAAGFPLPYPEDKLAASQDLAPFRALINNLVHGNDRLPCCVVDRCWRIQDANRSLRALFERLGWTCVTPDDQDVIDRILSQHSKASQMINRDEVARQFIVRLRSELASEDDHEIEKLAEKAEKKIRHDVDLSADSLSTLPLTICCHYRIDDEVFSAVIGISKFGAAAHVELSELRLVWFIPADKKSEALLERIVLENSALHAQDIQAPALYAAASTH